jgi:hypothetical protein
MPESVAEYHKRMSQLQVEKEALHIELKNAKNEILISWTDVLARSRKRTCWTDRVVSGMICTMGSVEIWSYED